jgi:hypothetical protein
VLLLLPLVLALTGAWFAVRWYVGDTIAEYGPDAEEGGLTLAQAAVRLAPDDPFTHWRLANMEEEIFAGTQQGEGLHHFEEAVRLSPNDYRFWVDLGRALEQSGETAKSEAALRRAVELAPAYSYPRWSLGNLLLRSGKLTEAFTELSSASKADTRLRPEVFNFALYVYGADTEAIVKAACPTASARAALSFYLIQGQKVEEGFRVWETLSAADKKEEQEAGKNIVIRLNGARSYRLALAVARDIWSGSAPPSEGQFLNGGFESDVGEIDPNEFGWVIRSTPQAQVTMDQSRSHSGSRSLRILFRAPQKLDTINVSQIVVVETDSKYRFECYARTEQLNSGGTPLIQVWDASDNTALGASEPLPVGTSDWRLIAFDFKTKSKTEAVMVHLSRSPCTEGTVCPIFGTVWYDDFNLKNITGGPGSSGAGKN